MAWHGMVWHDMVWYGMTWLGMAWYGMAWQGQLIPNWHGHKIWNTLEPLTCELLIKIWVDIKPVLNLSCTCSQICNRFLIFNFIYSITKLSFNILNCLKPLNTANIFTIKIIYVWKSYKICDGKMVIILLK